MELEWLEAGTGAGGRHASRWRTNAQPFGMLHGGASGVLVESIASVGRLAGRHRPGWRSGVELKVNHLRPVRSGYVTGTGVPLMTGQEPGGLGGPDP